MILVYPIHAIAYFVLMGIDIALFFLSVRLILTWQDLQWLVPFDRIGQPLVEKVTTVVESVLSQRNDRRLSKRGALILGIVTLTVMHYILTMLMGWGT